MTETDSSKSFNRLGFMYEHRYRVQYTFTHFLFIKKLRLVMFYFEL